MFGTLQKRLPQERRLAGITDRAVEVTASSRRSSCHNTTALSRLNPAEDRGTALWAYRRARRHPASRYRTVRQTTDGATGVAWHFRLPPARNHRHYVKANGSKTSTNTR